MQQQRQEVNLGKSSSSNFLVWMALILGSGMMVSFGFLFAGSELVRHTDGRKGVMERLAVQGLILVLASRVLPLTRRRYKITLVGQSLSVQLNEQLVWEKKCVAWRWRKSDQKNILGVELLDEEGMAYLVQLSWIPQGTPEPFVRLVKALERAGVPETEALLKRLPFTKDVGAWLGIAIVLLAIVGFSGLVWSAVQPLPGVRFPGR